MHYDLRAGLAAYLYTGFEAQSRTGVPLARPLMMDNPDDVNTWAIDDQYMLGSALMFAPAGMGSPGDTTRLVYFPHSAGGTSGTGPAWHPWFDNTTAYQAGTWATVPTPIATAPLFVRAGIPVPFGRAPGVLELSVWWPTGAEASTTSNRREDGQHRCDRSAALAELTWADIYDDDGETTRYRTNGEHWRARAGFGPTCSPVPNASWPAPHAAAGLTAVPALSMLLDAPSRSAFTVRQEWVTWTVHLVTAPPSLVVCGDKVARPAAAIVPDVADTQPRQLASWTHSVALQRLYVTAPLDGAADCIAYFGESI